MLDPLANRHIMPNNAKTLHLLIPPSLPSPPLNFRGHGLCKLPKTTLIAKCDRTTEQSLKMEKINTKLKFFSFMASG